MSRGVALELTLGSDERDPAPAMTRVVALALRIRVEEGDEEGLGVKGGHFEGKGEVVALENADEVGVNEG